MGDVAAEARVAALKRAFERITDKREKKVITGLVNEHRNGTLTPDKAYSTVIAISELRLAKSGIGPEDLQ